MTQDPKEKEKKAISFDIDDTMTERGALARAFGALNGVFHPYHLPNIVLDAIPDIVRYETPSQKMNPKEKLSLYFHGKRIAIPGVRALLLGKKEAGFDIYGNTGRADKKEWIQMTENFYRENGLAALITQTFYTPDGIKTAFSKAAALRELQESYNTIEHWDDDPRTIRTLAEYFPDITLHLIAYPTNHFLYPVQNLTRLQNVVVENHFPETA